jgi:hypothetical protein
MSGAGWVRAEVMYRRSSKARARRRAVDGSNARSAVAPNMSALAVAAGEQLVPREQGREGADDGHRRWAAQV